MRIMGIMGLMVMVLAFGCTTEAHKEVVRERAKIPDHPFVGMTKDQAQLKWGGPIKKAQTESGEDWAYLMNRGHAFIPMNFGYRPQIMTLHFDEQGVVRRYSYDK